MRRSLLGRTETQLTAVRDVSLSVSEGEVLGVVGESGCGKSTLARCLVGLDVPDEGRVQWDGEDPARMGQEELRRKRRHYQMVFQNPFASLDPRQRIGDCLEEPLATHGVGDPASRREAAASLLKEVGLSPDDAGKFPHEFSGGQRQRVGIARALILDPKLVVLDEPVSSLDVSVQASILNLLADLNRRRNMSALFISHDLRVVGYLSRRLMVLYLGCVMEEGLTDDLLAGSAHPYTKALLAASREGKASVVGDPPSPVAPPPGCPFHPRCPLAEGRCRREEQVLRELKPGWKTACWKSV